MAYILDGHIADLVRKGTIRHLRNAVLDEHFYMSLCIVRRDGYEAETAKPL
jgi:hypothetical protein